MKFRLGLLVILLLASILTLGACSTTTSALETPTVVAPTASFTDTPPPATDTPVPLPTDTPVPLPTDTPVPVPTETPTVAPTETPVLADRIEQIVGTWVGTNVHGLYHRFNEDGTWQTATSLEKLTTSPDAEGTYRFEGKRLVLIIVQDTQGDLPHCPSKTGTYTVRVLAPDRIKFSKIQDTCGPRAQTMAQEQVKVP